MISDLKFALRQLSKAPGFATIAILTLALCIGANSAIFSVVHSILLKPYPWPGSERLVYIYNTYPQIGLPNAGVSVPDYLDRRAGVNGIADAAMYYFSSYNLGGASEPERVVGLCVTPTLFSTLQSGAELGRGFNEGDGKFGAPRVVVLSHALWKTRFGSDRGIIGQTIRLASVPVTVVGVMPESFYFPAPRVQVWVPFVFSPQQRTDDERGTEFSTMIARLKPGVTPRCSATSTSSRTATPSACRTRRRSGKTRASADASRASSSRTSPTSAGCCGSCRPAWPPRC